MTERAPKTVYHHPAAFGPEIRRYRINYRFWDLHTHHGNEAIVVAAYDARDAVFQFSLRPLAHIELNKGASIEFMILAVTPTHEAITLDPVSGDPLQVTCPGARAR